MAINPINLAKTDISNAINATITSSADKDKFVKQIKNPRTGTPFTSYNDFVAFYAHANLSEKNEFFSELNNQIGMQFVEPILQVTTPFYKHHYRGQLAAGDYVQLTWLEPTNVIKWDKRIYTPSEYIKAGGILDNPLLPQQDPTYIKVVSGYEIQEQVIKGFVTPGTITAFNRLLIELAAMLEQTVRLMFYKVQIKILGMINNIKTYDLSKKPSYVTNENQAKMYFIRQQLNLMRQPSFKFNALGNVGDTDPRDPLGQRKLTTNDIRETSLSSINDIVAYMSPTFEAQLSTLTYSTTFNEQYVNINNIVPTIELLNIDVDQPAQPYIDPTISIFSKAVAAAYTKKNYDSVYLVEKDAFVVYDRFRLNQQALWLLNQRTTIMTYFGNVIVAWNNVGIRVDYKNGQAI